MHRWPLLLIGIILAPNQTLGEDYTPAQLRFFESKIRPVLVKQCYSCHSTEAGEAEGGLTLDSREGLRKGGDRGAGVTPGRPRASLLLDAIRHTDEDLKMPPERKLSDEVIADFEQWIREGAADPREGKASERPQIDIEAGRTHWAFQHPVESPSPSVKDEAWPSDVIDRFVLHQLEQRELKPAEDADRRTLLRRLSFDLTGLPPTESEMDAFLSEPSNSGLEAAIDRLLESPRFGEKWARHWLDVARYAESTGGAVNFYYPHAWRYRDYVIASFNADKPYDEFIREQLAGDLMRGGDPQQQAERLVATGFLAMGDKTLNERSGLKHELDVADEQIETTTQAFLGITVACARCHDHKFDPIPQADYYALAGIFRSTETCYGTIRYINAQRPSELLTLPDEADIDDGVRPLSDRERSRINRQLESVQESIRNLRDPIQRFLRSGQVSLLRAQLDAYAADGQPKRLAMGVRDKRYGRSFRRPFAFGQGANRYTYDGSRTIGDSPVYLRGEHDEPTTERIPRGVLQVLAEEPIRISRRSSGRLELAQWIASDENPLTARVLVNRVWLHLFGRGLVPTVDDFGLAGQAPSHPQLLDYLAVEFMKDQWSIKRLIRRLVLTRTYQMSSRADADGLRVDPDNVYLWRMAPRRLDAEALRDSMLAVSGLLASTPPVGSVIARQGEGPVERFGGTPIARLVEDPRYYHRSVYLPVIRDNLPEVMSLFDAADPSLITGKRQLTTTPAQGLYLMNNPLVLRAADAAAERALQDENEESRLKTTFERFWSRPPTAEERIAALSFLEKYRAEESSEKEVWSALCQALFATAEFQFRK